MSKAQMARRPRMRNRARRPMAATSLLGVGVLGVLSACGGAQGSGSAALDGCEDTYTVGFSHPVGEAQFVKALKNVVADYGPTKCVKVLLDNTTANNLETQRATVESWVTQKVDAIVFWPVDPSAYTNLVAQGHEQGTKWLTYVAPIDGQDGSVGFDSDQAGQEIAADMSAWISKNHPGKDIQAAVTTLIALPPIFGRWEKPTAALTKLGIPVVSKQDCSNQSCGLEIAEQVLRENPRVRVFISMNDDVALGTQKAIANAGLDPDDFYVAGYDGSPEGLENVKAGKGAFRVTMAIQVEQLGHDIIDNALAAVTGEGDSSTLAPSIRVTPADDAEIDKLLAVFKG
ncbi:sugar ABC transporter substrate-binding protein [Kribbella sp. CA-253562]|uniref:sugar ABC transporter substrate-binding protein n=1 Tax=Kribbella sp. CA-253562 TaxID=3239942 RepID=UPI003D948764